MDSFSRLIVFEMVVGPGAVKYILRNCKIQTGADFFVEADSDGGG